MNTLYQPLKNNVSLGHANATKVSPETISEIGRRLPFIEDNQPIGAVLRTIAAAAFDYGDELHTLLAELSKPDGVLFGKNGAIREPLKQCIGRVIDKIYEKFREEKKDCTGVPVGCNREQWNNLEIIKHVYSLITALRLYLDKMSEKTLVIKFFEILLAGDYQAFNQFIFNNEKILDPSFLKQWALSETTLKLIESYFQKFVQQVIQDEYARLTKEPKRYAYARFRRINSVVAFQNDRVYLVNRQAMISIMSDMKRRNIDFSTFWKFFRSYFSDIVAIQKTASEDAGFAFDGIKTTERFLHPQDPWNSLHVSLEAEWDKLKGPGKRKYQDTKDKKDRVDADRKATSGDVNRVIR